MHVGHLGGPTAHAIYEGALRAKAREIDGASVAQCKYVQLRTVARAPHIKLLNDDLKLYGVLVASERPHLFACRPRHTQHLEERIIARPFARQGIDDLILQRGVEPLHDHPL